MGRPGTVVCDLGGVVLRWEPLELVRSALARYGDESVPVERLMSGLFQGFTPDSDWSAFDRGLLDGEQLIARVSARSGIEAGLVRTVLDAVPGHLRPDPAAVRLLAALRAEGHRVVYLSNMPAPLADWLEADREFTSWFDDGLFSCRVFAVKPEPEIYRIAAERLDLDPHRLVMLDDREVNLEQAQRLGWPGVWFTDAGRCQAQLAALGWLPVAS